MNIWSIVSTTAAASNSVIDSVTWAIEVSSVRVRSARGSFRAILSREDISEDENALDRALQCWFSSEGCYLERNAMNEGCEPVDNVCQRWFCEMTEGTPSNGKQRKPSASSVPA